MAHIDGEIDPSIKLKSVKIQQDLPDPFSINEMNLIIEYLAKHCSEPILNYFEFAFFTGMRTSELIALKWQDINWSNKTIRVQRAKVEKNSTTLD